jgi:large repetitive protein
VNLTGNAGGTWISPLVVRADFCCGAMPPDRCVEFIVTLDSNAQGLIFNIASGAVPPGALYYQLNCGPPVPVGAPLCLSGAGPHRITFCKPGNNQNTYSITSIPPPALPNSLVLNDGCSGTISALGFNPATVVWNSISPGAPGAYNNYLSCTSGCLTTNVTTQPGFPQAIVYQVCGIPMGGCSQIPVCLTSTVTFNPTLSVSISPTYPTICFGQPGTWITAIGSGGTPPHNFLWSNGQTGDSIFVPAGTYSVIMGDISGCPPTTAAVTVTQFPSSILSNAGQDIIVCKENINIQLNGSVQAASGGIWMGGAGVFSPSATALNAFYTPTAAEIQSGSVTLSLITTGNGSCPPDTDYVIINIVDFSGNVSVLGTNSTCKNANDASATILAAGPGFPYTYSWNTLPIQTTATISNLSPGQYFVQVTDVNGCTTLDSVVVTEPDSLTNTVDIVNVSCFGGANGSIGVNVFGGSPPYTYLWNHNNSNLATATNLTAGNYSVLITDAKGCLISRTYIVAEPTEIILIINSQVNVSCYGGNNGSAGVTATGGTGNYSYMWQPFGGTTSVGSGLSAGSYNVLVQDANNCPQTITFQIIQPTDSLMAAINPVMVSCFGGNNGAATVIPQGGTAPYSFLWSNGATSSTISNLIAGVYSVLVTDSAGCIFTAMIQITEPPILDAQYGLIQAVNCFGGNDGSAVIYATGGTPGYLYNWLPSGGNGPTANGLTAGTYTVNVTDANSCITVVTVVIIEPIQALSLVATHIDVSCNGGVDGSAIVNPSGGTTPYNFSWSPNVSFQNVATGLPANTYTVTVTDANGCAELVVITILEPDPLVLTMSTDSVLCHAGNSGSANVTVLGGTPTYTYSWLPYGGNGPQASGLAAGTYEVIVSDSKGCVTSAISVVYQPSLLTSNISGTDVLCYGGNSGSASVNVSGGIPPYAHLWNPGGQVSANAVNLSFGTYSVTSTDANGCQIINTITINQPDSLIAFANHTPVSCNGLSDGTATGFFTGGTGAVSYQWSPSGGNNSTATGLSAGNYTLSIFDANGCTASTLVTIAEPAPLLVNLTAIPVSCRNGANGTANAIATGGNGNYTYSWIPGGMNTSNVTGLMAGNYQVIVTDSKGCLTNNSIVISQPSSILSVNVLKTDVSCFNGNDGTATISAAGGTAPYTYSWSNSNQTNLNTNLIAGNYYYTVTDANNCVVNGLVVILEPTELNVNIGNITDVFCFGLSTGAASVTVSGGIAPYTYNWSPFVSSNDFAMNLATGSYTVEVIDSNGCTKSISFFINQPIAPLALSLTSTNATCFQGTDGSATATVIGGTAPYSYSWNIGLPNSAHVNTLNAGIYSVTITDINGCVVSGSVAIGEGLPINLVISIVDATCNQSNGSASVTASGGAPGYTYQWTNNVTLNILSGVQAGAYLIKVTDANGCFTEDYALINDIAGPTASIVNTVNADCFGASTGSATVFPTGGVPPYTYSWNTVPAQTTITAINLSAGVYSVIVTDANGCIGVTITDPEITEPTQMQVNIAKTDVSCFGGSNGVATVTVSGGTPNMPSNNYTYLWSPSGGTGATANNLAAGIYTVYINDANNCDTAITIVISEPLEIIATPNVVNQVSCFGLSNGVAHVSVTGGTPGYNYQWLPIGSSSASATGLAAGLHSYVVTDLNGCVKSGSVSIIQPNAPLTATVTAINVSCFNGSNGSLTALASGGTSPYNYSWPNGVANLTGLTAGSYSLTVTDANGCLFLVNTIVTQPTLLTLNVISTSNVNCHGGSNGTSVVSASGGTAAYSYSWSSGSTNALATGLSAGTYNVSVTDANACQTAISVNITQPLSPLSIAVSSLSDVSCFGGTNGSASTIGSGGTAPYAYSWNPFVSSSSSASGLPAGSYIVNISDAKNCQANAIVTINQPALPLSVVINSTNVSCHGANNGSAIAIATGGNGGLSYNWFPISSTNTNNYNLSPGNYQVNVVDIKGCQATTTFTITQPPILTATTTKQNVSCFGGNNGSANVIAAGGTSGYSYYWSSVNQSGPSITGLIAGAYSVTATDANGCQVFRTVNVDQPPGLNLNTVTSHVVCNGQANGSIQANLSGGIGPYLYNWTNTNATGPVASGVVSGFYNLSVTDANGCTVQSSTVINQPAPITSNISSTSVLCKGGNTGTATVSASGGNGNFFYLWSANGATSASINGLSAGNYAVSIIDIKGCMASNNVVVSEPAFPLSVTTTVNHINCFGGSNGSATAIASGGTAPYTYNWLNVVGPTILNLTAGNYQVNVTDANGCLIGSAINITEPAPLVTAITNYENAYCNLNNGQAHSYVSGGTYPYAFQWLPAVSNTGSAYNLAAGNYIVNVTDGKGCVGTANIVIANIPSLTANVNSSDVSCNGGSNASATVSITGGFGPFTYGWAPSGQTSANANGLSAGIHFVKITDSKGCQVTATTNISQPPFMALSITKNDVLCFGLNNGSASVSVTGGSPGYSYSWNTNPVQTTSTATNLAPGNYNILVTDQKGCSKTLSTFISSPSKLNALIVDYKNITCPDGTDGSITAFAQYGTPPYNYQWFPVPNQNGYNLSNLTAGDYTLFLQDSKGCRDSATIRLTEPARINTIASPDQSICRGATATISASGGTYYFWSNNLGFGNNHQVTPNFSATYSVVAFDQNNCPGNPASTNVEVISLSPADFIIDGKPLICPGMEGMVYVSILNNSAGTLTYTWNPNIGVGPGVHIVKPTVPTTYFVEVENHCGDKVAKSFFVNIRPLPNVLLAMDAPNGCLPHTVFFDDQTNNQGDSIVSWSWDFGDGTTSNKKNPIHTFNAIGQYNINLQATTLAGCSAASSGLNTVVSVFPNPVANFDYFPKIALVREPVLFTNLSTGAATYQWQFGDGLSSNSESPFHAYAAPGSYAVTLKAYSVYGCTDEITKELTVKSNIAIPNAFTPNHTGPTNGHYDIKSVDNSVFFPFAEGIEEFHMMIFNRWGELIFESFDLRIGWDGYYRGILSKQDVYVWKINAKFIDKSQFNGIGDVLLLR